LLNIKKTTKMARMHSRKRGRSGSTKPISKNSPSWLRYKKDEVRQLVLKLAKQKHPASTIGLILRDSYGIPDVRVVAGNSIGQILKDKDLQPEIPEDLQNLIKRAIQIRKHMEKNKKDMPSKRGLQLTESKIRRLDKYYKKTGKLPKTWKYDPERARLLLG